MALYPLCRHHRSRRQAVAYAAETIVARTPDHILRADLLTTLAIFGKLAYPNLDVLGIIGREQMKESKFFQEVLEEGRLEGRRVALLETLDWRFGSGCVAELAETVGGLNDPEQLAELQRVATTCRRLADFRRALAEVTSRS
jgi:predicted transposase YdaD